MPETVTHPTSQVLTAFARGQLPEATAGTVAHHLERCASCRQAVGRLSPGRGSTRVASGAGLREPAPAPQAPPVLPPELADHPKYRIVRELGRGGMGVVYQAVQTLMDRPVAIKVINPSVLEHADALPRFQAEVKAAARLDHPNIVRAYDADQVGSLHLLVMEFVEGRNLADLVQQKGPLPVAHACHYVRQAALGLQHAFEQGMTHRDIKPHNLMLAHRGVVKILDFGLARLRSGQPHESGLTASGSFMGTPDYVAPEQATDARTADTRSDLYSLGCTLYHLLTGRPPFQEDTTVKLVLAHIEKEPPPLGQLRADVPAELAAVVSRLLAKDPAQRYQTPVEVAQALVPFIKAGATPPAPVTAEPAAAPSRNTVTGGETSRTKSPAAKTVSRPTASTAATVKPGPASGTLVAAASPAERPPGRRRWPLLAGVGGTVAALGLVGWLLASVVFKSPSSPAAKPKALLMLEVDQPGADVSLDGQPLSVNLRDAKGPVPIDVEPGQHKLRISKAGFVAVTRDLAVEAGNSTPVHIRLEPVAPVTVAQAGPVELPKVSPPVLDLSGKRPDGASGPASSASRLTPFPEQPQPRPPVTENKAPAPETPAPSRPATAPAPADPLRRELDRAQATYNDKCKRADAQLLAAFRRELRLVRNQHLKANRQLRVIEALTREQTAFEQNQTLPWSPRMRTAAIEYLAALRAAARPLRGAYNTAITHCNRMGETNKAEQLNTEKRSALAPRVAGTWDCTGVTFRRRYRFTLYVDGSANNRDGKVGWKFEHQQLVIRSKAPAAPGGMWIDICTLASDGQSFNATNQKRGRYRASLVQ